MSWSTPAVAEADSLPAALSQLQPDGEDAVGEVTILERRPLPFGGSSYHEVVRCRLPDGQELELFCKYSQGTRDGRFGHRGGLAYEAAVYRHVLQSVELPTARFYGTYQDVEGLWLFLEHLSGALSVGEALDPEVAMVTAAEWIGRFHATNERRLESAALGRLRRHDTAYYVGWARRAWSFARDRRELRWLKGVCNAFEERAVPRLRERPTVVHGEYYPKNLLFHRGKAYPVDWESAAIATGEIDLASLTEGWPARDKKRCEAAYLAARWGTAPPADFEATLAAARAYMLLRWLGDRPEFANSPGGDACAAALLRVASHADLL